MNLKVENVVLFLMVVADCEWTVLSFDSKCPPLKLVSGRSRYQWRGRSVRFNCMRSFQLVGVKYATCMNGKWDADVPICVKYGCRVPSTSHVNGQFIESYRGAVVKIVCNPGYSLIGSPSVYCNGIRWNESFPVCRGFDGVGGKMSFGPTGSSSWNSNSVRAKFPLAKLFDLIQNMAAPLVMNSNPALSCNFDDEDLCGWSQDPMHDFDWKKRNSSAFFGESGIELTFNNSRGHYMYIESSGPVTENDTARIFSPVYPPGFSNGTCFRFWYHMYGSPTGFLKVYVKPEGVELWNLIPSFWMNGDQGESWIQSFIALETLETPFQIVFEGVRGPGAGGETAFDDVRLTSAEECSALEATTSSTSTTDFTSTTDDVFSCISRCGADYNAGKTNRGESSEGCSCSETCESDGTCCGDYSEYCTPSPSTPVTTETTTQTEILSESTSPPSSLPSVEPERLPSPNPSPKHFNNESNEIDPGKLPPQKNPPLATPSRVSNEFHRQTPPPGPRTTPKSAILQPQPETKSDDSKTVRSGSETPNKMVPKVALPKPSTSKASTQKIPANGAEANATSNQIPRKDVRPGKPKPGAVSNSTSVTSSSTATTPARVFTKSNPNNIKLTYLEKPPRPNLSNDSRFAKGKPKEVSGKEPPQAIKIDKTNESGGILVPEIIEFGGTALLVLVVAVIAFFWYKRRAIRKLERDNMVEDSDSIVYEMESTALGTSEYHSLVCIRPGGLGQSV